MYFRGKTYTSVELFIVICKDKNKSNEYIIKKLLDPKAQINNKKRCYGIRRVLNMKVRKRT